MSAEITESTRQSSPDRKIQRVVDGLLRYKDDLLAEGVTEDQIRAAANRAAERVRLDMGSTDNPLAVVADSLKDIISSCQLASSVSSGRDKSVESALYLDTNEENPLGSEQINQIAEMIANDLADYDRGNPQQRKNAVISEEEPERHRNTWRVGRDKEVVLKETKDSYNPAGLTIAFNRFMVNADQSAVDVEVARQRQLLKEYFQSRFSQDLPPLQETPPDIVA